ncbi:MAG: M18 family aminopeptidase, partial [Clostridia bacterium]|nr:M18 family aminopeptidase [Clostridia bacterium]
VASHSDSPMFKVKENAELETKDHYIRLDVEGYGGMIMSSWFDRPLSVAGRFAVRTPSGIATRLVDLGRDVTMIPNVAIHMNREVNEGYKYQANVDLMPLWGEGDAKGSFRREIARAAGVEEQDILGTDLFVYNRMPGTIWGQGDAFFSAPRIDNLECAFASLKAIRESESDRHINVCAVFDNEEVGSTTKQGAASTFLWDVMQRILFALQLQGEDAMRAIAGSFMVSADNAHATHPNHPEYADPVNQAYMNRGIVVKFSARQKYTTDAVSEAVFRAICEKNDLPLQYFANRSDKPGGSTLGNISGTQVSIPTLDIGLAQLAMHSAFETAGTKDLDDMITAMRAFFSSDVRMTCDGDFTIS